MKNRELDSFGEILMLQVRDRAINQWIGIVEGRMKSPHSREIFERLQHLEFEDRDYIKQLFSEVVDTTLDFMLSLVEEKSSVDITFHTKSGNTVNIMNISDGLAGELYADDGWISRFSKFGDIERCGHSPP